MKIEVTNEQVLDAIKPITRASTDDYANTIKSIVYTYAAFVAYLYAAGLYIRDFAKTPGRYLKAYGQVAQRQQLEAMPDPVAVAAPIKPAPVKPAPTKPAPVKRSRKRSAKNASNTSPALVA